MAQTTLQVRLEEDLKKNAETVFSDCGIDMSSAIRLFLKQSIIRGGIPFKIKTDPLYHPSNLRKLRESRAQLLQGQTVSKTIDELRQYE